MEALMPTPSDADDETIVVKITGKGIDLERRLGIDALPRLMAFLFSRDAAHEIPMSSRHTPGATSMSPQLHGGTMERPVGVVEYLRDKRPQTSSDAILVLAGYLELHENRRPFSRDDIRRMIRAARLPEPANLPRDVGVAVAKGYIQPLGDGFQLTNSGLDLVGQTGPLLAPRTRGARGRRAGQGRGENEGG
jgi:hypothetical protein